MSDETTALEENTVPAVNPDENDAPRGLIQLPPGQLHNAEYQRTVHVAMVPAAVTLEDISNPAFLAHHAPKVKPWDRIEMRADDGSWYCEAIIMDCSRSWARLHVLIHEKLSTKVSSLHQAAIALIITEHKVMHRGPRGFSVVRRLDGTVLKEGLTNHEDADQWLMDFASKNANPGMVSDRD